MAHAETTPPIDDEHVPRRAWLALGLTNVIIFFVVIDISALNVAFCSPALDQPKLVVESVQLVPLDEQTEPMAGFLLADAEGEQLAPAGLNVTTRAGQPAVQTIY